MPTINKMVYTWWQFFVLHYISFKRFPLWRNFIQPFPPTTHWFPVQRRRRSAWLLNGITQSPLRVTKRILYPKHVLVIISIVIHVPIEGGRHWVRGSFTTGIHGSVVRMAETVEVHLQIRKIIEISFSLLAEVTKKVST